MKLKVLRPYRQHKIGDVIERDRGVADVLCNRRRPPICEPVEGEAFGNTVATLVPPIPGMPTLHKMVRSVTGKRKAAKV